MAIEKIGGAAGALPSAPTEGAKPSFAKSLGELSGGKASPVGGATPGANSRTEGLRPSGETQRTAEVSRARSTSKVEAAKQVRATEHVRTPAEASAVRVVEQVQSAQHRLDHVLRLAESGKTFTPAELLALQAHVYRASQELDLAGKVVEKATAGVKQVLQTQV